ncbi:MAG TPA: hypothetical protein VHM64_10400 [Candidatus Binatia bacterium]|nr:hypothetical protein [Candidatus Binatia bacterium]
MRMMKLWTVLLAFALVGTYGSAQETDKLKEFRDEQYLFRFLYPGDWKFEPLPEGEKNPAMRARLLGPSGSSFVAIVEKISQPLSKLEFQPGPRAKKRVETMMRQTLEQTYHSISKNLGAVSMKTGERLNLSDETAVKFYLATLHSMKTGNPVVVAGTHVYPFSKDYSVNFIMMAFHRGNAAENQVLTAVFNSFRMIEAR